MDETLKKIRAAYYEAARVQLTEYDPLPKWDALPIQLREALIHMWHVGREDSRREWR
jgi:hypothetical protein